MYRAIIALTFVGGLLCIFAFQAIADGKPLEAVESGLGGVAVLIGAYLLAKRTILRDGSPIRRTKRKWVDDGELPPARTARPARSNQS
jgi:hypothetical protein